MADERTTPEIVQRGEMLPPEVVKDLFSKVKGHSSIAKLVGSEPIGFNGNTFFTFSMDDEATVVGEGEAKERGHAAVAPVTVRPLCVEYGARFSDQMWYGSEDARLDLMNKFAEGCAKKVGRAVDIIGFHGINPRTKAVLPSMTGKCFDATTNSVVFSSADPEANLEDAIAMLGEEAVTCFMFSKDFGSALGKLKVNGVKQYPEFALGGNPGNLNGSGCDVNSTVSYADKAKAYVGNMEAVKWGYAKNMPLELIKYGDPDNTGRDLKGHNEIYLRTEAYIAAVVIDIDSIAKVVPTAASGSEGTTEGTGE